MNLKDQENLQEALKYCQRALSINERVFGSDHPNVITSITNIGLILYDQGDSQGAVNHLKRALNVAENVFGPDDHLRVAPVLEYLAYVLACQGNIEDASPYLKRISEIFTKTYGPNHPFTQLADSVLDRLPLSKGLLNSG